MYFAPPTAYDEIMKTCSLRENYYGRINQGEYQTRKNNGNFTDPMTAVIFISIAAAVWVNY